VACSNPELTYETMIPFRYYSRTPWIGDRPIARSLRAEVSTTQENSDIRGVGFEPMIPVLERPKTIRTLDRAANGTGVKNLCSS